MHLALLTVFINLLLAVQAILLPGQGKPISSARLQTLNLQPFQISHIYTRSFTESGINWNRSLTFLFEDPNANTSTICTTSWTQTPRSPAPSGYIFCNPNGNDELFHWQFLNFLNIGQFTIQFRHAFSYPEEFPPPYEWVGMSSSQNAFNLTCLEQGPGGLQGCFSREKIRKAYVNGVTN